MTEAEIAKYQARAKYVATKSGRPELADDFAQEVILKFYESPDRGATVDQLFVDYLRGTYGDTRSACGAERSRAIHTAISLDAPGYEDDESMGLHDCIATVDTDTDSELQRRDCAFLFTGRENEIFELYFVEEKTEKQIGRRLEITESRVCQILKPMKQEIKDYYLLRESLERMEWDENFSKLSIDWIKL